MWYVIQLFGVTNIIMVNTEEQDSCNCNIARNLIPGLNVPSGTSELEWQRGVGYTFCSIGHHDVITI